MSEKISITATINGVQHTATVEPRRSLVDFLRHDLGLVGTHVGCEHGVCGACTVMLDGRTVRSCLLFAAQADGSEVTTIEGIGTDEALHPLQVAFQQHHALQCGFCTPGMLIMARDILRRHSRPSVDIVRHELSGQICRCTGYANIVKAIVATGHEIASVATSEE
jgi:aerobic-type carbon monoxide dehydrogenase small subunit (CoxS/CutS family)